MVFNLVYSYVDFIYLFIFFRGLSRRVDGPP